MGTSVIVALISAAAGLAGYWFQYKNNKNSDQKKAIQQAQITDLNQKIEETEMELTKAMETNITDVPGLRMKLETYRGQLQKLLVIILLFSILPFTGCKTWWKEDQLIVVGERIFYVKPGETVVVPALKSPAKQWYLIDNVAMLKVLGIDKPVESPVIGSAKK